jgi:hypothetical protein
MESLRGFCTTVWDFFWIPWVKENVFDDFFSSDGLTNVRTDEWKADF